MVSYIALTHLRVEKLVLPILIILQAQSRFPKMMSLTTWMNRESSCLAPCTWALRKRSRFAAAAQPHEQTASDLMKALCMDQAGPLKTTATRETSAKFVRAPVS